MWNKVKRGLYVPVLSLMMVVLGYSFWNEQKPEQLVEEDLERQFVDLDQYFVQEELDTELVEQVLEPQAMKGVEQESTSEGFLLQVEDGHVVVYNRETSERYLTTGIMLESLPKDTQEEIKKGKEVLDEMELFSFLETHSS